MTLRRCREVYFESDFAQVKYEDKPGGPSRALPAKHPKACGNASCGTRARPFAGPCMPDGYSAEELSPW